MKKKKTSLFNNPVVENLVVKYKKSTDSNERNQLFETILLSSIPYIEWICKHSNWLTKIRETDVNAVVSDTSLRLPKILENYKIKRTNGNKTNADWGSYFAKCIENRFRHWNRGLQVRDKYSTDWPKDENGEEMDIADSSTMMHNSSASEQQRIVDFERKRFLVPLEIADKLPRPYQNMVRFIAKRFLDRADNKEKLFINELRKELAQLPIAKTFTPAQLENLVRLTIASVRSSMYDLREEITPEECEDQIANILENGDPKIWPLLGVFDPVNTVKMLHCLAGALPSIPPTSRFIKKQETE